MDSSASASDMITICIAAGTPMRSTNFRMLIDAQVLREFRARASAYLAPRKTEPESVTQRMTALMAVQTLNVGKLTSHGSTSARTAQWWIPPARTAACRAARHA
jgi:hypothetical protein